MSPPPAIDVLLPVRLARSTLPEAVADVLAQRGVEVRVLAVVDTPEGQDDGSREWLERTARKERRLVVLPGEGRGAAAALHLGLAACEAPLVSHMEADDRCPPDRLASLARALTAPPVEAGAGASRTRPPLAGITSRVEQMGASTRGMDRYLAWQNALLDHDAMAAGRFIEIPALHQTGLYRRDALEQVGGYLTRGPWPADIDFWFRWFEHDLTVAKLPRVLYRWRQHPAQSTRSSPRHDQASLRAAKLHALARLHGTGGRDPRPLLLVSTGTTLDTWRGALEEGPFDLVDAVSWAPGQAAPRVPGRRPPDNGPAGREASSRDAPGGDHLGADTLVLAVYGMSRVRAALDACLPSGVPRLFAA